MNLLLHTVKQEKQRIEYMLEAYQATLDTLPKGTIWKKTVGSNIYYYLKYREGKKIRSQYISKVDIDKIKTQLAERHHIETMVKSLLEEKALADKILEGAQ